MTLPFTLSGLSDYAEIVEDEDDDYSTLGGECYNGVTPLDFGQFVTMCDALLKKYLA